MAKYRYQVMSYCNNAPAGSYGIFRTRAEAEEVRNAQYTLGGLDCWIKRIKVEVLAGDSKKKELSNLTSRPRLRSK